MPTETVQATTPAATGKPPGAKRKAGRPRVYDPAALLASSILPGAGNAGVRKLAKATGASKSTVHRQLAALRAKPDPDYGTVKQTLAQRAYGIASDALDRVEATIGEAGCRDAMIVAGISVDKALVLTQDTAQDRLASAHSSQPAASHDRAITSLAVGLAMLTVAISRQGQPQSTAQPVRDCIDVMPEPDKVGDGQGPELVGLEPAPPVPA